MQFNVFSDQGDRNRRFGAFRFYDKSFPGFPIRFFGCFQFQPFLDQVRDAGFFKQQGNLIKNLGCDHGDDRLFLDVAELGNFFADTVVNGRIAAGHDHIRCDADGAQLTYRVLSRFGF